MESSHHALQEQPQMIKDNHTRKDEIAEHYITTATIYVTEKVDSWQVTMKNMYSRTLKGKAL